MTAATNASNSWTQAESPPNPLAMLNFGVPGVAHVSMPQLLGWAINSYAPLMLVLGGFAAAKSYIYQLLAFLESHFTTELHVEPSDPSYDMLMAWVFSQGLDKLARSKIARVSDRGPNMQTRHDGEEKPIWFAPWHGSFWFWFGGTLLSYRSYTTTTPFRDEEHIVIKCIGRSGKKLDELMEKCREQYLSQKRDKTTVFEHRNDLWKPTVTTDLRPLSSVIIPGQQKQQLVEDLQSFRDSGNRAKYSGHHIPYRRGYLLHGPPGTGKSSLTAAIAGQCKLDIYIVDIPSLSDERLRDLLRKLPEKCIVLLEDIDAVGADREKEEDEPEGRKHSVSLAGLLNALDGVASQEGRILIMTTNHIEKLDSALIRPGRIDLRFELNYADSALTAQLFEFMYTPAGEAEPLSQDETLVLERLAREFADAIPEHTFSIAQIMSYILQNWDSPTSALKNVGTWVKQAMDDREAKRSGKCSRSLAEVVAAAPPEQSPASEEDGEGPCMRRNTKAQCDIPRTKKYVNLHGAACVTPPSSPCENNRRYETFDGKFSCISNASPHLPAQSAESFGGLLAAAFPEDWFSDDMDDSCTDVSDGSSDGLFIVPLKLLPANVSRTASYESCPGLACPSQSSLALTEPSERAVSESWIMSGCHGEDIERKVSDWRSSCDGMLTSAGDPLPVKEDEDGAEVEKFGGHGINNQSRERLAG